MASPYRYTCQLFLRYKREIFILGLLGFLKTTRSFPKKSESLRTRLNASSLPVFLTSKIRDREVGIVIYSFYTWFSFLTSVWVNIFLEIVSSKTAATHIFSIRREKLARKREPAWDRSFQPAGVRVGRCIQSFINLGKPLFQISRIWIIAYTWFLARLFVYLSPFVSQILDFLY